MDTMREPGRAIGREIGTGEGADAQIDAFISRRHVQRVKSDGERALEDLWRESERRQAARRRKEVRAGWYGWHLARADLYARLSAEHTAAAEGLLSGPAGTTAP